MSEVFSIKEVVVEIRDDVKALSTKLDRIDREGSIGTRAELVDHETRLRNLERTGFRLSGVWTTLLLLGSALAGLAGLGIGLASVLP